MKFSKLATYFERIEKTASRLEMTQILAELYKDLAPEEFEKTVYLLQGRVVPAFEKIEFGMAEKTVVKAVISALSLDKSYFEAENRKSGDVGKTTELFKNQYISFEAKDLTVLEVYHELYRMATTSGNGSQEMKKNILSLLIRQLDPLSCRYVVRIPAALLRLGFSDMTVLDAYSWMIAGDKSLRLQIEQAYHVRPDLGFIGRTIKEKGIEGLSLITPKVFTPIIMMRAERLSSGEEIVKQIGECAIEPKYDGFRLQVHYKKNNKLQITNLPDGWQGDKSNQNKQMNNEVRLYSRSLEDVTFMYPDIVAGVKNEIDAEEAIFEGEAIGFDPHTGAFLPFQETVQRKRKYDIEEKAKEIPLKLFTFELLYCDGVNFIHRSFTERRNQLEKIIKFSGDTSSNSIVLAPHTIMNDGKAIEKTFEKAIGEGLEGIIAKKLDGIYQPGARAWNWIKFKRSYSSKINDTIDCVVMGFDAGKGKRTDFGIGAFLVGVYDDKKEQYLTVAKIGTGLTDEEWRQLKIKAQKSNVTLMPKNYLVDKLMVCDVWVEPRIVVEIRADEITKSPIHSAGYAFRFPRLERFRDDKKPEDSTSLTELFQMIKIQEKE